ncbi:MAG: apolipoprotein N-acyltransferase [Actinomycetota bacterium]
MVRRLVPPFVAGLLVAASMPPWGWWPLALVGCALYARSADRSPVPFRTGAVWALGWFVPSLVWMWWLTAPGYVLACLGFAVLHGAAGTVASVVGGSAPHLRRPALVAAHALAETARLSIPFGGVPLATLAVSQSQSPVARFATVGGAVLVCWTVMGISFAGHRTRGILLAVALLFVAVPFGSVHTDGTARFAVVQGGGEQGTHAIDTDPTVVFDAHVDATRSLAPDERLTAVVWPENVINMPGQRAFEGSPEHRAVAAEARRLGVPFIVGITEDAPGGAGFTNAQVVVQPDGRITARYDKRRRVPFGEYMPMRGVLDALGAPVELVPRDAVAGTGPAFLDANNVRAAVAISWEVFFGGRVNEGVASGGRVILNPTNGSSYTLTVLQTQQIASSRVRAREQGRWVVQAAPTGFSAFVSPDGTVLERTGIGERRVITADVELRSGRTPYSRTGNEPWVLALVAWLCVLAMRAASANRRGRS